MHLSYLSYQSCPPLSDFGISVMHSKGNYASKSLQSCLTLCDPIDGSPLGSSVPGILQARILEWVAITKSLLLLLLSRFSRVRLCATP